MIDMPYFLTNKEWFTENPKTGKFKLTDKAPPEAVKSFKQYQAHLKRNNAPIKSKNGTWYLWDFTITDQL